MEFPEEIKSLIFKKFFTFHVLDEMRSRVNKLLGVLSFYCGLKQVLYFERDILNRKPSDYVRHVVYCEISNKLYVMVECEYQEFPVTHYKRLIFN